MRFIGVCGGRDYENYTMLSASMAGFVARGDVIVHGGARGADSLSGRFAEENGFGIIIVPAIWSRSRGAGFARNEIIANLPLAFLIAFKGGNGTADMVKRAIAHGIKVHDLR